MFFNIEVRENLGWVILVLIKCTLQQCIGILDPNCHHFVNCKKERDGGRKISSYLYIALFDIISNEKNPNHSNITLSSSHRLSQVREVEPSLTKIK